MNTTDQMSQLKDILYLTDFSPASRQALPFVTTITRRHNATVRTLHVVVANRGNCLASKASAERIDAERETVQSAMCRLDSEAAGMTHQTKVVVRDEKSMWSAVEEALECYHSNLIVVGTHGRPNSATSRSGATAELMLRHSTVPVLTVGPRVSCGISQDDCFHRLLYATNFESGSSAAVKYSALFAKKGGAQLLMMHVMTYREQQAGVLSVAETIQRLYDLVPHGMETQFRSEAIVRFGEPSKWITRTANERCADLISMDIADISADIAYRVASTAPCPVLTVRSPKAEVAPTAAGGLFLN